MRQARKMSVRASLARLVPVLLAFVAAGCVGVPALDSFKYQTQSEREDAQALDDADGTDDVLGLDNQGNDTLAGDTGDKTDAIDAADTPDADAAADADVADADVADADVADAATDAAGDADGGTDAVGTDAVDVADADTGPDVPPPECVTATDCGSKWTATQLGPCQAAACVQGACAQVAKSGSCDDANVCTLGDACAAGKCVGQAALNCDDGDACSADKCDPTTGCYHVKGAGCEDGNACTADTCDATNACVHLATDATCSDGNACTLGDSCTATVCAALDVTVCNDDNACTDDSCDPAQGCVFLANAITCDDGDVCTLGDACGGGGCVPGTKNTCSDGNPCTDDACDPANGCIHVNNYVPCDDGNKCTPGDTCQGGTCIGLAVAATAFCDDKGNPCTDDSCDPLTGCAHTPNTAACDDGLPCTIGDICDAGKCTSGVSACECKKDSDCAVKEDGNPCNGTLICDLTAAPYKCVVSAKTIVVCESSGDSTCAKNTCNKINGICSYVAQSEGGACDADGSVCTDKDVCKAGDCSPGAAIDCDDGQPCTTDNCDKVLGCQHSNNSNACNDGNACTVGDVCSGGSCVPGAKTVCDDGNACTVDSCNASTGNCLYAIQFAASCSDGNACSSSDTCDANGSCVGSAVTCNDGLVCTSDSCNPASGCVYAANTIGCDDGNACTINDTCGGGVCLGTTVTPTTYCNDNNVCTSDACSPAVGCTHAAVSGACDDGNNCTTGDVCAAGVCTSGVNGCGCTNDSQCVGQEDGNLCNGTLFCDLSVSPYNCKVKPSTIITCSTASDSFCAKNTCNPLTGACALVAQNENQTCNADNSVCTPNDACKTGTCTAAGSLGCDDANPCTTDACDPVGGCTHTANTSPCSDGNACTTGDVCSNAQCTAGAPVPCNDGNVCTTDSCNQVSGACAFINNTNSCDDNSLCTTNDKCIAGACVGNGVNCNDGNVCTDDDCVPATGCTNVANAKPCTDGDPCTVTDVCANKACQPGNQMPCNDSNPCTSDSCSSVIGACVFTNTTLPCDDGKICTTGDTCSGGACVGAAVVCDDKNACTTDSCDGQTGCVYKPAFNCDDGNACTVDSCDGKVGACVNDVASAYWQPCNDGNPCTGGDYCTPVYDANGTLLTTVTQCQPGYQNGCDDQNTCTTDTCDNSQPKAPTCVYSNAGDGTACNTCTLVGVVAFNQNGTCANSVCSLTGSAATCDDGNICTRDTCYVGGVGYTGGCSHPGQWNIKCDDNNVCTTNDMCSEGGTCWGSNTCDDGNWCTNDACSVVNNAAVCSHTYATAGNWCDDGNQCTNDVCGTTGNCIGTPFTCTDSNTCTIDSCDKTAGCSYLPLSTIVCTSAADCGVANAFCSAGHCYMYCDDGNPCSMWDFCDGYNCSANFGIQGAIACTAGSTTCGTSGSCINGFCNNICTDGNACTVNDACAGGSCAGTQVNCDDSNVCTNDACNAVDGTCLHTAHCDDGNPCTTDTCSAGTGTCTNTNVTNGIQCGSANVCVSGSCQACGYNTVPIAVDDNGAKKMVCAFDYPVWGIRPHNPASFTVASGVVTDNFTGLQWMQNPLSGTYTWPNAPAACDTSTIGGFTDWRMPTLAEQETIQDFVVSSAPTINPAFFSGTPSTIMWSASGGWNAWGVNFGDGATYMAGVVNPYGVRCVRGQTGFAPPATRFTVSSDTSQVHDAATDLVWQRTASPTTYTSPNAAGFCSTLGIGGGTGRVPTIRELESITDRADYANHSMDVTAFGTTPKSAIFWSATPSALNVGYTWAVDFTNYGAIVSQANGTGNFLRCVHGCDDANPCTADKFDIPSWSCTHTSLTDNTACGGAGLCSSGTCNCGLGGAVSVSLDDSGTQKFQCVFDLPAWGNVPLKPTTLTANGDGTVSDSATLLTWQATDSGATASWTTSQTKCDTLILAGKADWRLPTVAELDSIVDYTATTAPTINTVLFPGTGNASYWSNRINAQNSANYWFVSFATGVASFTAPASVLRSRCVRGGLQSSTFGTRFSAGVGSPTNFKDGATNLFWAKDWYAPTGSTQAAAMANCAAPWRLPNIRELGGLVDRTLSSTPALGSAFLDGNFNYWSNTIQQTYSYSINFGTGLGSAGNGSSLYYARCVKP